MTAAEQDRRGLWVLEVKEGGQARGSEHEAPKCWLEGSWCDEVKRSGWEDQTLLRGGPVRWTEGGLLGQAKLRYP